MSSQQEISLEETNKIRISLGLKPIPISKDVSASDSNSTQGANQNSGEKTRTEDKKEDDEPVKLEGKSLGDEGSSSMKSWLEKLKKKQQKTRDSNTQATKVKAEMPKEVYGSQDLKGIRVAHDMSDIQGQVGDVVLTLKDTSVLDEEGEIELESSELIEKKKLQDKLKAKKGKYLQEDDLGVKTSVLSKYDNIDGDEEIDQQKGFTLDGSSVLQKVQIKEPESEKTKNATRDTIDFDVQAIVKGFDSGNITGVLGGDYLESKPAKFKKPKKKKISAQSVKRKFVDDDDDIGKVDDDFDIQRALSESRRKSQKTQLKKAKLLSPQELAEEIKNDEDDQISNKNDEGMVISSTTDFLTVIKQQAQSEAENKRKEHISPINESNLNETVNIQEGTEGTESDEKLGVTAAQIAPEELSVSGGLANTLKLLRSYGVIEENKKAYTPKLVPEYSKNGDLVNYKPEVNIQYRDDSGRVLSTKEAYKHLSHQFHGKGPGKSRVEKQLKKDQEERKKLEKSIFGDGEGKVGGSAGVRLQ